MTMTRQAFRGTLSVFNGNETIAMTDVHLNLEVRDEEGRLATSHEFQTNVESLDQFDGDLALDAPWTLAGGQTGTATILFIPTRYAAPTADREYSFGGTLSYVDPFTGLRVERELYPVTLTVKPSPVLDLTYFMQRDVLGDDALTTDVVEPTVPAEFALLVRNTGKGDATNVRIVTEHEAFAQRLPVLFKKAFRLTFDRLPQGEEYAVNLFNLDYYTTLSDPDYDRLQADLEAARALDADLIAVIIHWGVEYQNAPNTYQTNMARFLVEQGADLVLGSHPHVLQPYETISVTGWDGRERQGFVCYSLGNFISNQQDLETRTTAVLELLDGWTGEKHVFRSPKDCARFLAKLEREGQTWRKF